MRDFSVHFSYPPQNFINVKMLLSVTVSLGTAGTTEVRKLYLKYIETGLFCGFGCFKANVFLVFMGRSTSAARRKLWALIVHFLKKTENIP